MSFMRVWEDFGGVPIYPGIFSKSSFRNCLKEIPQSIPAEIFPGMYAGFPERVSLGFPQRTPLDSVSGNLPY